MFRLGMLTGMALLVAALATSSPAAAGATPATPAAPTPLLMLKQNPATHPERMLMLFDRLAGLQPDFPEWAEKSPFLQKANVIDRDSIISREENRMRRNWSELDIDEPVIVHTTINLKNYSTLQEQLVLEEFNAKTFFSYSIYDENIAIVPKDIAAFGKIAIPKTQMDEILQKTATSAVKAELILKPVVADGKTPFVHNNTDYWLILAEIGEIRFWTDTPENPKLLWMRRADWYKPKENASLLDLKSGGIDQ